MEKKYGADTPREQPIVDSSEDMPASELSKLD
jgi:hypothetical protein